MKNKKIIIVFVIVLVILFASLYLYQEKDKEWECCEDCICGDTIELLNNKETSWNLAELNNEGEYVYKTHTFINFDGTKSKFTLYLSDEDNSKVGGNFDVNESNEIVLFLDGKENGKITCKLVEEKYLLAMMQCDNDFGTFTLQKHGLTDIPYIIKETISNTKTIVVNEGNEESFTITEAEQIKILLSVINNSKMWTGAVISSPIKYKIELLDSGKNSIAKITYHPKYYFEIEINGKIYFLSEIDKKLLNKIL